MLNTPTLDKLHAMNLRGMARVAQEQMENPSKYEGLTFDERLAFLVDAEFTEQESRRLRTRLKAAKLRLQACMEDLDYRAPRKGLDRALLRKLADCQWVHEHRNVTITGPTGVGKSFVACALAHEACLKGLRVLYFRVSRLLPDLELASGDGRYPRILRALARADVLLLDDFGLAPLQDRERRDLLEILEDRYGRRSTIVTSQLPAKQWHDAIGDPTIADAILDRLIHNAYEIRLQGPSKRKEEPAPAE
jgi:DNA replication protein DnaC